MVKRLKFFVFIALGIVLTGCFVSATTTISDIYWNITNLSNFTLFFVNGTNGTVGINTSSPQNMFNVIGDINATTSIFSQGNNLSLAYNYSINGSGWVANFSNFSTLYGNQYTNYTNHSALYGNQYTNYTNWTTLYTNFSTITYGYAFNASGWVANFTNFSSLYGNVYSNYTNFTSLYGNVTNNITANFNLTNYSMTYARELNGTNLLNGTANQYNLTLNQLTILGGTTTPLNITNSSFYPIITVSSTGNVNLGSGAPLAGSGFGNATNVTINSILNLTNLGTYAPACNAAFNGTILNNGTGIYACHNGSAWYLMVPF